jgi:CelD/BcsL family acetyltransferase involved in cellulose biosynthesis
MSAAIAKSPVLNPPLIANVESGTSKIIEKIEQSWQKLCLEGPCNQPFFRPECIRAYLEAFAPDSELVLLTCWRGKSLRAVLPLLKEYKRIAGLSVSLLRSTVNSHYSRFDLIHGKEDQEEAAKLVWRTLMNLGSWDFLKVSDVPARGAFDKTYLLARKSGFKSAELPALSMPRINFETESLVGELTQFRSFRKRLPGKLKKLEALGEVNFRRVASVSSDLLDDFYRLESAGWKGKKGTAISCNSSTRRFYDQLAEAAEANNYFSMYVLELNRCPIAMHYGMTIGDTYYAPKVAYDENYKPYSPGQLLVMKVVQDCKLRKIRKYELLGTLSDWKKVWANEMVQQKTYFIFAKTYKGQACYLIKFVIPALCRRLSKNALFRSLLPSKLKYFVLQMRERFLYS